MSNQHDPELLREIRSWLQTALVTGPIESRGHSDQSGHPHRYAAVLIPDWQIKQKVAAIDAALESLGPYLVNHADAVDGSYCIARRMPNSPLYEQYWSGDKWSGAGQVFKLHPPRSSVAGAQPPSVAGEDSRTRPDSLSEITRANAEDGETPASFDERFTRVVK